MIIDGHAHLYSDTAAAKVVGSFTEFHRMEPNSALGKGTLLDLQKKMAEAKIDYTVVANFAVEKNLEKINTWTLELAKEHKNLIPLVSVVPGLKVDKIKEYLEAGACGIKMHNGIQGFEPTDEGLKEIYAFCQKESLPITFHCGETSRVHMNEYTDMSHILPVLRAYPGIPFVLTHLAAGEPELVLKTAEECPNAYFDTSITFSGEHCIYRIHNNTWENDTEAVKLFRRIGLNRVNFGSDYPYGKPESDIRRFKELPLTAEEKSMILGENTWKLYEKRVKESK